jgi:hypothetical protein
MMQTYSHGGAVPVSGAIATVLAGSATAVIGGIVYAYALRWIPFVYVNFILTMIFGGAMGYVVCAQAQRGKIRNNTFLGVTAILVGLLGMYVYWAAYLWALAGIGNVGLWAFWPPVLVGFGQHLFEKGSWGFKGDTVTGWILVGVWLIEAGTVLWFTVSAALSESRRPFCESCHEWTEIEPGVARLVSTGDEPGWQQVLAGDLPSLAEFPPATPDVRQFVRLDAARCPKCEQSRFLTVSAVQVTIDKKGNAKEQERRLISNAVLRPGQFAVVEACGELYRQAQSGSEADEAEEVSEPPAPAKDSA